MIAISEQEKLNNYFEVYSNVRYNLAKKRRELEITLGMASILSGVSQPTIQKMEQFCSAEQDIRLSSLIDICTLFKMDISEVFAPRPEVESGEKEALDALLTKMKVAPTELPENLQNDFANYIGDDKFVDRNVYASWYRIYSLKNHAEPKEKLNPILAARIKKSEIGKEYKYNKNIHSQVYAFIRTMKPNEYTLRYLDTVYNVCVRIK